MSASGTSPTPLSFLDLYEPLEVIGNGSFGIIRKVRRKSDGEILARKELKFERMSERDRKQIVAEVNILKDLNHENIVRYIDRFVDRDAGVLYILMEYCDGGDLSSVIKQSARTGRLLPEDTVWSYFLQLLLALQQCHCPNAKSGEDVGVENKRQQIMHRDLKPENVFISKGRTIKLGDFGLSKALTHASFANTYVGTPYYMSPELIQEKAYDTKSDIWSLGCLIYELCALKPPFHEAQTHSELSALIRNGRIPPLPKVYSSALNHVIKAMLNLNPAMRPSAQQLLQHERIDFARKVADTEKMLISVKAHKATVVAKEKELQTLSANLAQKETELSSVISQKDAEISRLTTLVSQADERVKRAVAAREAELLAAVMRREEEVRTAMTRREEEILDAVRKREDEINSLWQKREEQIREEFRSAMQWVETRQKELEEEAREIEAAREKLVKETEEMQQPSKGYDRKKTSSEDVKHITVSHKRVVYEEPEELEDTPRKPVPSVSDKCSANLPRSSSLDTPLAGKSGAAQQSFSLIPGSAMRGVVLTATGETLQTPAPFSHATNGANAALTNIIKNSPRVGLNFRKIFDFADSETSDDNDGEVDGDDDETTTGTSVMTRQSRASSERVVPDLSTPTRNVKARPRASSKPISISSSSGSVSARPHVTARRQSSSKAKTTPVQPVSRLSPQKATAKKAVQSSGTKIRKPLSRVSAGRAGLPTSHSTPALGSGALPSTTTTSSTGGVTTMKSMLPLPPTPRYDPSDEENLPSPFLRRVERGRMTRVSGVGVSAGTRRKSAQNMLRAKAAANAAKDTQGLSGVPTSSAPKEVKAAS